MNRRTGNVRPCWSQISFTFLASHSGLYCEPWNCPSQVCHQRTGGHWSANPASWDRQTTAWMAERLPPRADAQQLTDCSEHVDKKSIIFLTSLSLHFYYALFDSVVSITFVIKGTKSFRKGRRHRMNHMAMTWWARQTMYWLNLKQQKDLHRVQCCTMMLLKNWTEGLFISEPFLYLL